MVYKVEVAEENYENICYEKNKYQKMEWITDKELKTSAISTAMLKVLKLDTDNHSKVMSSRIKFTYIYIYIISVRIPFVCIKFIYLFFRNQATRHNK